jgi:hypothetical protein
MYTQVGCVLIETVCIEHSALWPVSDQIITSLLANFTCVSKFCHQGDQAYTVKITNVVTSIKQPPVLKGHIFHVLS